MLVDSQQAVAFGNDLYSMFAGSCRDNVDPHLPIITYTLSVPKTPNFESVIWDVIEVRKYFEEV